MTSLSYNTAIKECETNWHYGLTSMVAVICIVLTITLGINFLSASRETLCEANSDDKNSNGAWIMTILILTMIATFFCIPSYGWIWMKFNKNKAMSTTLISVMIGMLCLSFVAIILSLVTVSCDKNKERRLGPEITAYIFIIVLMVLFGGWLSRAFAQSCRNPKPEDMGKICQDVLNRM